MNRRKVIYWTCQVLGWGILVVGNLINLVLRDALIPVLGIYLSSIFLTGIAITHVFRGLVQRWKWTELGVLPLLPRVFLSVIAMSLVFTTILGGINGLLPQRSEELLSLTSPDFFIATLNFTFLFALWAILYFSIHYFEKQRNAELRNLELRAVNTEVELNNLRNQLRPHFMFNSLNSIRALIDENPTKAKNAVTSLSAILRNTLLMGKHATVPLSEEMELVKRYLEMESIRYEERLEVNLSVPDALLEYPIPPFVLQLLAENAVKHGIARRREGGRISIAATKEKDLLQLTVKNTGQLAKEKKRSHNGQLAALPEDSTSTGLENLQRRLILLYDDTAYFSIRQEKDEVICQLEIPSP